MTSLGELEREPCHRCRGSGLEPERPRLTPAQAKLWGYLQDAGEQRAAVAQGQTLEVVAERARTSQRIRQLAERAKEAGLTQEQIASAVRLTRATLHRIRSGRD